MNVKHFNWTHLPENLKSVSKPIGRLAQDMEANLKPSAEKDAGLRKLLEAKDCFVRAKIEDDEGENYNER